jgi:hypothetical protein
MLEYMTRGRALAAFASFMEGKWHGMTVGQAASRAPDSGFDEAKSPSGMILILSVYAFKAACVGALVFSSHPSWFIVAFAGAATVQAHLAGLPAPSGGVPFMETPDRAVEQALALRRLGDAFGRNRGAPAAIAALALAWGLYEIFRKALAFAAWLRQRESSPDSGLRLELARAPSGRPASGVKPRRRRDAKAAKQAVPFDASSLSSHSKIFTCKGVPLAAGLKRAAQALLGFVFGRRNEQPNREAARS